MRKLLSIALAGLIGSASVAAIPAGAEAAWKNPPRGGPHMAPPPPAYKRYPAPPPRGGNNWGPAFATGAIVGLGLGAFATAPRYYAPPPVYYYPPPAPVYYAQPGWNNAHVEWCLSQYRSYNPSTNTFIGYDGYAHECVGPY